MRKPRKRKHPSKELLEALERLASQPRICLGCQDRWHRERFRRADKLFYSQACQKRIWWQGVDAFFFKKDRESAEYNERAFEDELEDYREQLRTGRVAVNAFDHIDKTRLEGYQDRPKAGRGEA